MATPDSRTDAPSVLDNREAAQFELSVGGHLAKLEYRLREERLVLVHTEVPDELGGQGIGGVLVRAALARAVAEGLTVVPNCPFARGWLEKHPDEAAAVTIDW